MRTIVGIATLACWVASCTATPTVRGELGEQESTAPSFFMPPAAQGVRRDSAPPGVSFSFEVPYPATMLTSAVDEFYRSKGWTRRDELLMFRGQKTSDYPNGWSDYLHGEAVVHSWAANWESPKGEYVTYRLEYRVPQGTSVTRAASVSVQAVYQSAEAADRIRQSRGR